MNAIVIKLKKRKTELGLTNRELATMSGVPYGTVCRLLSKENYTPNLQTLKDLAKALDVSIDDIVGLSESPKETDLPAEEITQPSENDSSDPIEPAKTEERIEAVVSSAVRAYEMLLDERQRELENKDQWIKRLFVACCVLMGIIVGILILDILNPSIGFFQR